MYIYSLGCSICQFSSTGISENLTCGPGWLPHAATTHPSETLLKSFYIQSPNYLLGQRWAHVSCTESFSAWILALLCVALPLRGQATRPLLSNVSHSSVLFSGLSAWGLPFLFPFLSQSFVLCIHTVFLAPISHMSK